MIPLVNFSRQNRTLKKKLLRAVEQVIDGQAYILGPDVALFEQEFASYCGVKYAVGVASGFDAILLSLRALGIGKGDEVITAANTFISTVLPVLSVGATPVLVDADQASLSMDVSQVADLVTRRTRAIIPVHLFGLPVDMDPLMWLAKEHRLFIIEDACQAHGARYKGKKTGSIGDVGCFSFYPSKNLGAFGDAGAVTTNSEDIAERIRVLRNVGQKKKNVHTMIGVNSRLDTIQAAVLRVKLPYLDRWVKKRQALAARYSTRLRDLSIVLPSDSDIRRSSFHLYVIRATNRDDLKRYLEDRGIVCGIHYPTPVHLQPCMVPLGYKKGDFPVSEQSAREMLSLPLYPELTVSEIDVVVRYIKSFFRKS
ncbi:DegT/DnrJ/EryC1/StrS family aminotransferase [Candidatus Gottesmanbacteria bacterium]|nr:DegT/DnrJ/EryC1/StrS family aminotransferase [Candidatus Gottesmanbacteria bacterium]